MPIVHTKQKTESNWLQYEEASNTNKGITRQKKPVTFAVDETIATGTIMGQITGGAYIVSKQTAADGSEVPKAIWINTFTDTDPKAYVHTSELGGTRDCVLLTRGTAVVGKEEIILDASWVGLEDQVYAALEVLQINVDEQI